MLDFWAWTLSSSLEARAQLSTYCTPKDGDFKWNLKILKFCHCWIVTSKNKNKFQKVIWSFIKNYLTQPSRQMSSNIFEFEKKIQTSLIQWPFYNINMFKWTIQIHKINLYLWAFKYYQAKKKIFSHTTSNLCLQQIYNHVFAVFLT